MSPASYALLILLVAVTNTVLGFGLAVLLGHGPHLPREAWPWRRWLAQAARWRPKWKGLLRRRKTAASPAADDDLPPLKLTPIHFDDLLPAPANASLTAESLPLDAALAQLQREVAAAREELAIGSEVAQRPPAMAETSTD